MLGKKSKIFRIIAGVLLLFAISSGVGFFVYTSIYYEADETAIAIYEEGIENGSIVTVDNMTFIIPDESTDVGIVFYPGAKVEHLAYIPILTQLAEEGITVVLMEMPFNMAIFDIDAADDVWKFLEDSEELKSDFDLTQIDVLNEVKCWYMMGHSMGGAMASSYAADNQEFIEGLLLIGAYVYGDYPVENALTIYGTFNDNLEENIDYTENIVIIEGGNHAQYGNYGKQDGDPDATISDIEQQEITVDAIVEFIFE